MRTSQRLITPVLVAGTLLSVRPAEAQDCDNAGTFDNPCAEHPTETLSVPANGNTKLFGANVYAEVLIQGTVDIETADPADPRSGWLWLRSRRIEIGTSGSIDATGRGHGKVAGGPGAGITLPFPMGQPDEDRPQPGGGASHAGLGGQGLAGPDQAGCSAFPGNECDLFNLADPGVAYDFDFTMPQALVDPLLGLGSAGGGSYAGCPNTGNMIIDGANGGGVVILEANEIIIDGVVLANGGDGQSIAATGTGAGAGGSIILRTLDLSGGGRLEARGGNGVADILMAGNSLGGAGGGGLITLFAADADGMLANSDVTGGIVGACDATQAAGHATAGVKGIVTPPTCLDADGDGYEVCSDGSGKDCDDGRASVSPDACESCNGVDDDCDGDIDDEPADGCEALCSEGTGFECIDGSCGDSGQGGAGGSGPAPEPPAIRVGGGLCSAASGLTGPAGHEERHLGWLTMLAGLALLWVRRR